MNITDLNKFNNPSTFSYISRHLLGLSILAKSIMHQKAPNVGLLGCGPFEPLVASRIFSTILNKSVKITAIDKEVQIQQISEALINGEAVSLKEISNVCHNKKNDGSISPNMDFLDQSILNRNIFTYKNLINHNDWLIENNTLRWVGDINLKIKWRVGDASKLLNGQSAIFCGALTVNLSKIMTTDQLFLWIKTIYNNIQSDAYAVFCVTPEELTNQTLITQLLLKAGFKLDGWVFEKIAISKGKIFGDIAIPVIKDNANNNSIMKEILEHILKLENENIIHKTDNKNTFNLKSITVASIGDNKWGINVPYTNSSLWYWTEIQDKITRKIME